MSICSQWRRAGVGSKDGDGDEVLEREGVVGVLQKYGRSGSNLSDETRREEESDVDQRKRVRLDATQEERGSSTHSEWFPWTSTRRLRGEATLKELTSKFTAGYPESWPRRNPAAMIRVAMSCESNEIEISSTKTSRARSIGKGKLTVARQAGKDPFLTAVES